MQILNSLYAQAEPYYAQAQSYYAQLESYLFTASTPTDPQNAPITEDLTTQVQNVWDQFLVLLQLRPQVAATEKIKIQIDNIDQAAAQNHKPTLILALRKAFFYSMQAIQSSELDPTQLPKNVALQLTEILGRYGIAIYASKDVKDPFQSSLDVLKTAILMQEYALGLRDTCPNLTLLQGIEELFNNEGISALHAKHANQTIENMDSDAWADKVKTLNQNQQLLVPQILRYTNGAMRYLNLFKTEDNNDEQKTEEQTAQIQAENVIFMKQCGKLLNTAKTCLKATVEVEGIDQAEVKNQLAELIYNDLTGYASAQREEYEAAGKPELAAETKAEIDEMWKQCVALSKRPLLMQARVDNKRTFIEKLSLDDELTLRTSSLEGHLSLPEEQQDPVLIAISFHNIANLFARLDRPIEALYASIAAVQLVGKCRQNGENNVQFDDIIAQAQRIIDEYKWVYEAIQQHQAKENQNPAEENQNPAEENQPAENTEIVA